MTKEKTRFISGNTALLFERLECPDLDFYGQFFQEDEWTDNYFVDPEHSKVFSGLQSTINLERYRVVRKGQLFGFVHVLLDDPIENSITITGGVHPRFINSGLGIELVNACLELAAIQYSEANIFCYVKSTNPRMLKLLSRHNFRSVGLDQNGRKAFFWDCSKWRESLSKSY